MPIVNPYLNFLGNCEEAFEYYRSIFGGEFNYVGRYKDMTPQEGFTMSADEANKIMHIGLPISKETFLMGSDIGGEWAPNTTIGNNISLSVTVDSKEEADRIYNALAKGGMATMPMNKTFWGDYFGMCTDKFNINWMVSYNENREN
jgi:PhnB protein